MRSKPKIRGSTPIPYPTEVGLVESRQSQGCELPRRKPAPPEQLQNSPHPPASRTAHRNPCSPPEAAPAARPVNQTERLSRSLSPHGQNPPPSPYTPRPPQRSHRAGSPSRTAHAPETPLPGTAL